MRKNLVLLGMMGVGKSTLGRIVANKCRLKFIDVDSLIEKKNLMRVSEIFSAKGEDFFRLEEEKIALDSLNKKNCIISLGGGAFENTKIRDNVLSLAISIWLDVSVDIINKRLKKSTKRPMLKNKNVKERLQELYDKRKDAYNLANNRINCDKLSINEISKKIIDIYENQ